MTGLCSKIQANSLTGISKQRHHIENRIELFTLSGTHAKIYLQFTTRWHASTDASRDVGVNYKNTFFLGILTCASIIFPSLLIKYQQPALLLSDWIGFRLKMFL